MNVKPLRFAVNVRAIGSWSDWTAKARWLEALGYYIINVPDHLADLPSPFSALVAAAATTRLRVGTNVLNNDLRHPVLVAREAATVDVLSGGRLPLGLGAGSIRSEYDEAGLHFDRGSVRVARLARLSSPELPQTMDATSCHESGFWRSSSWG
jgi:alkanesulfonate monooxygenase SsuD/methylene tetrahydromethanopterin reductase-like flavin-dependent oxidoreductase (luciferase family)